MFDDKCTVLPIWVRDRLFNVTQRFPHRSKNHPESETSIIITHPRGKKTKHIAHVTTLPRPNLGPVMRLQFGNDVKEWLSKAFIKTFQRNEERKANGLNGPTIERLIPFWEFIDIEWDCDTEEFHFRAWYSLHSNEVQSEMITSPSIPGDSVENKISPNLVKDLIHNKVEIDSISKVNDKFSFQTECGHTVKVNAVKKIGGQMEGRLYAQISGPKINGKSGKKTLYFDRGNDIYHLVDRYLGNKKMSTPNQQNIQIASNISAWLVLQNPESIYADVEGECYEYPRSIPNGTRIASGDYLICSLATKKSKNGKRIFGIGRILRVEEFLKEGRKMRKAFYDWYREFPEPKTFEFIGGDPRVNVQHSMNPIPKERVNSVVNLLVNEFIEDRELIENEMQYHSNSSSNSTSQNQFPDWLSQALNDADN